MAKRLTDAAVTFKGVARFITLLFVAGGMMTACSINPATGDKQFTALMPAAQEQSIGASEHPKILAQYGGPFPVPSVEAYVNRVGQKVAAGGERTDITYKFFVLDTPDVNAFAMPGGYIYVTRGLLGLANNEAELAGVLAHEMGHITARHSAERYSQEVLTNLGVGVLSAALDSPDVTRVAGIGSTLALRSYSRSQEYQADELGVRYLARAGYSPYGVRDFLKTLDAHTALEAKIDGHNETGMDYFATHPQTDDRVARAGAFAVNYPPSDVYLRDAYLRVIDGLVYGDSARTGFIRGQQFIHPDLGFMVTFPENFKIKNTSEQVMGAGPGGAGMIVDGARNSDRLGPDAYLTRWVGPTKIQNVEPVTVNGKRAAVGFVQGRVNGKSATIRMMVIEWAPELVYRVQMAIPAGNTAVEAAMRDAAYSFRAVTPDERAKWAELKIHLVTARAGDSVKDLAYKMNLQDTHDPKEQRFRVLNALGPDQALTPGQQYKIVW